MERNQWQAIAVTIVVFEYVSFRLETKECASEIGEITMNMVKLRYLVSMRRWHVPTPQQIFSNAFFFFFWEQDSESHVD